MVRLNKNQLKPSQLDILTAHFEKTIGKLSTNNAGRFLRELLGHEEYVMLAKRLAIIILLIEGQSLYKIAQTLKISPATATKVQRGLRCGAYAHIVRALEKNRKDYLKILETLDSLLHLGGILSHYNGHDRLHRPR